MRIQSDQLEEGALAEVVIVSGALSPHTSNRPTTWAGFIGIGANPGRSIEEIDASIRELRDEWPR